MRYVIKKYDGDTAIINEEQAKKIATTSGMMAVKIGNNIHYYAPGSLSSIEPLNEPRPMPTDDKLLDKPDYRGTHSPAKEAIKQKLNKGASNEQQ